MKAVRIAIVSAWLAMGLAAARTADDYLHGGASRYIQGRLQEASVEVEEGLRHFPDDARLKALAAQLKSMKDQQKKDQGGGEGRGGEGSPEKQDRPDSSQGDKGQGKRPEDKEKEQGKDRPEDQGKDDQGSGPEKDKEKEGGDDAKPPQESPGKEGDSTGNGAAPVPPGQMSKEEAERLLNSYQDDEKREQKNLQRRYKKPIEAEQDW